MEILLSDPDVQSFLAYYPRQQLASVLLCLLKHSISHLKPKHPPLAELETWCSESSTVDASLKKDLLKVRAALHKLDKKMAHTLREHNIVAREGMNEEKKEFHRSRALSDAGVHLDNHRNYNEQVQRKSLINPVSRGTAKDMRTNYGERPTEASRRGNSDIQSQLSNMGNSYGYRRTEMLETGLNDGVSNSDPLQSDSHKGAADIATDFLNNSVIARLAEGEGKFSEAKPVATYNYRVSSQTEAHIKKREELDSENSKWDIPSARRLRNNYERQFGGTADNREVKCRLNLDDWRDIRHQYI